MNKKTFCLMLFGLFLLPAVSHAQYMGGPGDGLTPFFEPQRFGWVHEGGAGFGYLTGESRDSYVGGGGVYYSGLFRFQPTLAAGIHAAGGAMDFEDTNDSNVQLNSINYVLVAAEGRVYIPAGMLDFWGSVTLGGGRFERVNEGGISTGEVLKGTILGFGVGGDFYLTPNLSVGGHLRMYRMYPKDEQATGDDTLANEVGMWMTIGVNAALHY